ncbi:MAG: hypothetical protein Q9220_000709 [cf. Caloplaca sp. 1 TL-2023]
MGKVGYHISELSLDQIIALGKLYFAAEPLWVSSNTLVKLSIMHLYIQIFRIRTFRRVVYGVMALTISYWLSTVIRSFFLCTPLAYTWDRLHYTGSCVHLPAAYLSVSIINLILDVIVIALPMPMLWRLQMPTSKKAAITAIFGVGGAICVITILRIVSVHNLDLNDLSYTAVEDGIWSDLEPCLGIVNACLPVLQPAVAQMSGFRVFNWTHKGTRDSATVSPRQWLGAASSPTKGIKSHDRDVRHFQELGDDWYLLREGASNADCRAVPLAGDRRSGRGGGLGAMAESGDIKITKGWEVSSINQEKDDSPV